MLYYNIRAFTRFFVCLKSTDAQAYAYAISNRIKHGTAYMERIMWTVVYMSQDRIKVNKILAILESNEIISMVKASGEDDFDMGTMYEILVPKTELEFAQELILDAELAN